MLRFANLMEIKGNGRECPAEALPKTIKTTKISKNNQNNQNHQTPSNLMEIKGNGRGCNRGGPTTNHQNHQNNKKNKQHHQNHQKPQNLREIKGDGKVCTKGAYQKPPKQATRTKTTNIIKNN